MITKAIFILCLLYPVYSFGQSTPNENISVILNVAAGNKLSTLIESYCKRELRELPDICLQDNIDTTSRCDGRHRFIIDMLVTSINDENGIEIGQVLCTLVKHDKKDELFADICDALDSKAGSKEESKILKVLNNYKNELYSQPAVFLNTIPSNGLKTTCQELIAQIDVEFFEPYR